MKTGTKVVIGIAAGASALGGIIWAVTRKPASATPTPTGTTGSLSGKVTDGATGQPISGVTVAMSGATATTGSDGTYTIIGIPPGTYTVIFTITGYASVTKTVTIAAGTNTLNISMAAQSGGNGSMSTQTDTALANAAAAAAAGNYASARDIASAAATAAAAAGDTTSASKAAVAAANYETIFQHGGAGNISVYLYDPDTQQPVSGVSVSASSSTTIVTTGSDGKCLLSNLWAGDNLITATKSGYDGFTTQVIVIDRQTVSIQEPMFKPSPTVTSFAINMRGAPPFNINVGDFNVIDNTFQLSDGSTQEGESDFVKYYVSNPSLVSLEPTVSGTEVIGVQPGIVTIYGVFSFPGQSPLTLNTISLTINTTVSSNPTPIPPPPVTYSPVVTITPSTVVQNGSISIKMSGFEYSADRVNMQGPNNTIVNGNYLAIYIDGPLAKQILMDTSGGGTVSLPATYSDWQPFRTGAGCLL